MTLNQIVDSIADGLGKSLNVMFKERIKFAVKYWRVRLIKQEIDKGNAHDLFYQSFIVPLQVVDMADHCSVVVGCPILRSVDKVPKPIRSMGVRSFAFVGSVTGNVRFEQTNLENVKIKMASKYRSKTILFDYVNDYLYIWNNTKLTNAKIRSLIDDLDALKKFQCDNANGNCYSDDMEFPIPSDLVPFIINGLLTNELKMVNPDDKEVDINIEANDRD